MTEIHIQLAGIKLGPYSEKQVRQYLTEGLLSLIDPARLEGTENWIPVGELLANLPPAVAGPPPLEPTVEPTLEPVVETPPVKPTPEPKAEEVALPPIETKPAPGSPQSKPIRITSGPVPIPSQSASVSTVRPETKRVAMSEVVKSLAQRSVSAVKRPPANLPPGISTTSPMPPPTVSPETKPAEAKKESAPATAKSSPPAAPVDKGAQPPPASPAPTSSLAQQMTGTSLPSMVRALAKKPATTDQATAPVKSTQLSALAQTQKAAEKPVAKISDLKPEPTVSAPVKSEPPKTEPPASTPPKVTPTKAEPVKIELRKIEAPKADPPKTESAKPAPSPEKTSLPAAPTAASPAAESTPVSSPETIPPARSGRSMRGLIYAVAGCALLGVVYIGSSYHAASSFWQALNTGDHDQLADTIDFPATRNSLKEEMKLQVSRLGQDSGSVAVLSMIDNSIDRYVTPEGISALANKSPGTVPPGQGPTISTETATSILLNLNYAKVNARGLEGPTDFVIDTDMVRFHLHFTGTSWKLDRVELKSAIQLPTVSAAPTPAPAPSPASPLASSVVETYLTSGNDKCQKGDWDGAIADFTQALAIDPKVTVAYNNRGFARQSRQAKGDLDGAIADFTQALALDPKLASAYFSRGSAEVAKGDLDSAIADYTQAVGIDPKMAQAYYKRGNAKSAKNDLDGAIADYTQALTLDPNQASAYSNRGVERRAKNDLDGAIADFTQALAINPKIAEAYFNRGLARQAQENDEAAILDFNQAIDLDPKMARAYYNRGNAKNAKGDPDGAIGDYTQAVTLDPTNALAFCNRGVSRQAKGDLDGAVADYTQAVTLDPGIAIAYYNRGLIKEQKGDPDGAIADSTRALDLDPKNAQAYYNRGFATLTKGNLAGASADLQKFCEMAPRDRFADHARLYLWLIAKAQSLKSDADQALSSSMISDWNSSPDDLVTKIGGFLLDRVSEPDLIAAAISSDAGKDQGQHCEVWYFAGMKRLLAGDKDTALDYFHKALATGQKDYCEYILAQAELLALEPAPKN